MLFKKFNSGVSTICFESVFTEGYLNRIFVAGSEVEQYVQI